MINETNITCFLSVAETKNFTESARRLFLTQQAVSKNVMQLERDAGLNLIDRNSRTVSLTPEGEKYREVLLNMVEYYNNELNMIKMFLNSHGKNIDISCQNFIDFGAGLKRAVDQAKEEDPDLTVRITRFPPGEMIERLDEGLSNMILMYKRYAPTGSGYVIRELFRTRTSVLVSRDHPLVEEDSTYLDFKYEPYIIDAFPGESENALKQRAKRESVTADIEPVEIITVPNRESAYATAALGSGILLGTDVSQIPQGYDILRYMTDATESICVVYKASPGRAVEELAQRLCEIYG